MTPDDAATYLLLVTKLAYEAACAELGYDPEWPALPLDVQLAVLDDVFFALQGVFPDTEFRVMLAGHAVRIDREMN